MRAQEMLLTVTAFQFSKQSTWNTSTFQHCVGLEYVDICCDMKRVNCKVGEVMWYQLQELVSDLCGRVYNCVVSQLLLSVLLNCVEDSYIAQSCENCDVKRQYSRQKRLQHCVVLMFNVEWNTRILKGVLLVCEGCEVTEQMSCDVRTSFILTVHTGFKFKHGRLVKCNYFRRWNSTRHRISLG